MRIRFKTDAHNAENSRKFFGNPAWFRKSATE